MCKMCDPNTPTDVRINMMIGYITHRMREIYTKSELDSDCRDLITLLQSDIIMEEWSNQRMILALLTVSHSLIIKILTTNDLHNYQPRV